MKLNIKPTFKVEENTFLIDDPLKVRSEEKNEDFVTDGKDAENKITVFRTRLVKKPKFE